MGDFQINSLSNGLNFFGHPRKNGYIPGYLFSVASKDDFSQLKQILTRCIFEAQAKKSYTKADDFDEKYLEQQLVADMAGLDDVLMAEEMDSQIQDFDFVSEI